MGTPAPSCSPQINWIPGLAQAAIPSSDEDSDRDQPAVAPLAIELLACGRARHDSSLMA
jgi:hypothetical protein